MHINIPIAILLALITLLPLAWKWQLGVSRIGVSRHFDDAASRADCRIFRKQALNLLAAAGRFHLVDSGAGGVRVSGLSFLSRPGTICARSSRGDRQSRRWESDLHSRIAWWDVASFDQAWAAITPYMN